MKYIIVEWSVNLFEKNVCLFHQNAYKKELDYSNVSCMARFNALYILLGEVA